MKRAQLVRWVAKPTAFVTLLLPALILAWDLAAGNLSVNPIEDITHRTGRWGLILLLVTLAVTPVRRLTGWSILIRFRRMIGLFAFFYLLLHFSTYVVLDQFFSLRGIADDVVNRPYITVGFASLLLLVPLALTSTKGMIKRLGGRRWANLHRLIYVAAGGGIIHFVWLVKADYRDPTIFGIVLVLLLASRLKLPHWRSVPT